MTTRVNATRSILRVYRRSAPSVSFESGPAWRSRRRYLLTVGFGAGFREAAERLQRQAERTGWFDGVIRISGESPESWVQEFLSSTLDFRRSHPRGFGLWSWKPFCVLKTLGNLAEGAHLYYMDGGCELSALGEDRFKAMDGHVHAHGCLFFTLPFLERDWTKPALLARFGESIAATAQVQATWFGLANVASTRDLVSRWWQECSKDNFNALIDPTGDGDSPTRHRHDQSVLSCVVKSQHPQIATKPWEDLFVPWLYVRNSWVLLEPVHALRRVGPVGLVEELAAESSMRECHKNLVSPGLVFRMGTLASRLRHRIRDELVLIVQRFRRRR